MRRFQQKLIIPAASRPLVARLDLTERLERAISSVRVVALAAPAGWGKTTALAQWAAATSLPVAWYALDSADGDPSLFLDYLLHTVADFAPDARDLIARLASAPASELPQICHAAALAIAASPAPFALVLDDFHLLSDATGAAGLPLIQSVLSSLAEYAPNCHMVVASRTPPALHGMVRLIAQQRAAVFDYTALQFSATDVQQLAGASAGVMLSDGSAERLTNQLGGWVTGIVLSLDQVRGRSGLQTPRVDVAIGSHPPEQHGPIEADTAQVYAFLAEQVITPLPEDVRAFLEDTSVLDHLSPRRCDALRETNDSGVLLDTVKHYGLFVSSRAGWLSYHSLFRDFLRARLARDPLRERRMLRRAAQLYAAEDEIEAAVDCYLAASGVENAQEVLRGAVPRFRRLSRHSTLLVCFDRLAEAQAGPLPPDLLIAQARVYSDLVIWERAYLAVQLAETIGSVEQQWEALLVHADLLRIQGDQLAARQVLDSVPFDALPDRLRVMYHMRAGQLHILEGSLELAIEALEQAQALAPQTDLGGDPSVLADIYDNLGWAYVVRGDRPTALRYLQRADACWQAIGNTGRRAMTLNNIGVMQVDEALLADARASFETGLELARATGRRREETVLLCSIADLDLVEGAAAQSLARFGQAHALAERVELLDLVEYAAAGACWTAVLSGDEPAAERWSKLCDKLESEPLVRARIALARALRAFMRPQRDIELLGQYVTRAAAEDASLPGAERAYLQLAMAELRYLRAGWAGASELWARFEKAAASLPDQMIACYIPAHEALFTAAGATSALARRALQATGRAGLRRWQVSALGGFSCLAEGRACELTPLYRALLARLLDAGPHGLSVERLWESVWGEADLSMTALHQALRRLRVQTGLSVAVRDGTCAVWSDWGELAYDVRQLEQTLEEPLSREMIERALALYRGEFLPGAPDGASYWVETRRANLQERFLNTLELYAGMIEPEQPQAAQQYYQRILQIDGCREQTAVRLMRLAARFGNRTLVNATFEQLTGALRVLNATPGAATAALYRQLH